MPTLEAGRLGGHLLYLVLTLNPHALGPLKPSRLNLLPAKTSWQIGLQEFDWTLHQVSGVHVSWLLLSRVRLKYPKNLVLLRNCGFVVSAVLS